MHYYYLDRRRMISIPEDIFSTLVNDLVGKLLSESPRVLSQACYGLRTTSPPRFPTPITGCSSKRLWKNVAQIIVHGGSCRHSAAVAVQCS